MTSPDGRITVNHVNVADTSAAFGQASAKADALIAELTANNTANLNEGNWVGTDQQSYQAVHQVVLKANMNISAVLKKTGVAFNTVSSEFTGMASTAAGYYAV